ncbi:MAG: GntR family transcriptional regulator [Oscillospiraceae bacterium]
MAQNRISPLTLSQQAKGEIYRIIQGMDLEKSNKLPREEALAEQIGVSRITIRQALNDLSAEGTVFRRQGKGTFVNVDSLNIKVKFSPCMEFSQMIQNSGYTPSVKLLNIAQIPRDETICALLEMEPEEQLVVTEKLFFADDKLCAFCRDYFSLKLIGDDEAFAQFSRYENSIFQYIYQQSGQKIQWDKVEIDTILAGDIAGLSDYVDTGSLGGKPLLYLKGVNYSNNDRPLIYACEYINTSLIRYNLIRQKNILY